MLFKKYIYIYGDECNDLTGGINDWNYGSETYQKVNILKNESNITVKPGTSNKRSSFITTNKIDLTEFSKLVFEIDSPNTKDTNEWFGLGAIVDNSIYEYAASYTSLKEGENQKIEVDVSSLQGFHYIGGHLILGGYAESPFAECTIKQIYLSTELQDIEANNLEDVLSFGEKLVYSSEHQRIDLFNKLKEEGVEVFPSDTMSALIDKVKLLKSRPKDILYLYDNGNFNLEHLENFIGSSDGSSGTSTVTINPNHILFNIKRIKSYNGTHFFGSNKQVKVEDYSKLYIELTTTGSFSHSLDIGIGGSIDDTKYYAKTTIDTIIQNKKIIEIPLENIIAGYLKFTTYMYSSFNTLSATINIYRIWLEK